METDLFAVLAMLALIGGVAAGIIAKRRGRRSWLWFLGGVLRFFLLVAFGGAM